MAERLTLLLAAPNWLGDLVMSTSLFDLFDAGAALDLPRPDLHVSVRRRWRPLLEGDPRLAGLIDYERNGAHGGLAGLLRQARDWRRAGTTGVLLLPPSLRAGLVARLSGLRPRIGFREDGRGPLLTHGVIRPVRGRIHYTEELTRLYAAWIEAVTGKPPPDDLPAPLPRLAGTARRDPVGLADGPPIRAVGIGATYGDAKSWPVRHVADLVERLHERSGCRVVLLGDAAARGAAQPCGTPPACPGARTWRERPAASITWDGPLCSSCARYSPGPASSWGTTAVPCIWPRRWARRPWASSAPPVRSGHVHGGERATAVVAEGYPCRPLLPAPMQTRHASVLDDVLGRARAGGGPATWRRRSCELGTGWVPPGPHAG